SSAASTRAARSLFVGITGLLELGKREAAAGRRVAGEQLLDVLADQIDLEVDVLELALLRQRGGGLRVRDDRDLEAAPVDAVDREADAVDGDRAFLDDVAEQLRLGADRHVDGLAARTHFIDAADAVDVAGDQVAAEAIAEAHRPLEVHRRAGLQLTERGALERLRAGLDGDAAALGRGHGQAHAVDGQRRAERLQLVEQARGQRQAPALPRRERVDLLDAADVLDESREHASFSYHI